MQSKISLLNLMFFVSSLTLCLIFHNQNVFLKCEIKSLEYEILIEKEIYEEELNYLKKRNNFELNNWLIRSGFNLPIN